MLIRYEDFDLQIQMTTAAVFERNKHIVMLYMYHLNMYKSYFGKI